MFPGPLRAFHEVAQTGSIRRAAETLRLSPSSVSRQIDSLEAMVGTRLLGRSSHGVVLTHAGKLVAEYAKSAVLEFDALRLDLNDLRGSQGLVRLALVESIVSSGPLTAASMLRQSFHGITFDVQVLPATEVEEALIDQRCDIAITFSAEARPDITIEGSLPEPLMLACPLDHPLAQAERVALQDLAPYALALPARTFGVRRLIDRTAYGEDLELQPVLTSNSFEALRTFVRAGAGVAILPRRALDTALADGLLKAVSFTHAAFNATTLDIIRLRRRRIPRIIRLYGEILRQHLDTPHPEQGVRRP